MKPKKGNPDWEASQAPGILQNERAHYSDGEEQSKCSVCGDVLLTEIPAWAYELDSLAARFSELGIGPDLAAVCMCEAWGLFLFLSKHGP